MNATEKESCSRNSCYRKGRFCAVLLCFGGSNVEHTGGMERYGERLWQLRKRKKRMIVPETAEDAECHGEMRVGDARKKGRSDSWKRFFKKFHMVSKLATFMGFIYIFFFLFSKDD